MAVTAAPDSTPTTLEIRNRRAYRNRGHAYRPPSLSSILPPQHLVRVIPCYDGVNDISNYRLDVLFGVRLLDGRLATRLSGSP